MKDRMYDLDEYKSIGTYWITLYGNDNKASFFDSFEVVHIPKEIKKVYWE